MMATLDGSNSLDSHTPQQSDEVLEGTQLALEYARVLEQLDGMALRLRKSDQRRRALLHLIEDFNAANMRLANQRKAMLHILSDYEQDRRRLVLQTERLDNSRRALLHILQDAHRCSNVCLGRTWASPARNRLLCPGRGQVVALSVAAILPG